MSWMHSKKKLFRFCSIKSKWILKFLKAFRFIFFSLNNLLFFRIFFSIFVGLLLRNSAIVQFNFDFFNRSNQVLSFATIHIHKYEKKRKIIIHYREIFYRYNKHYIVFNIHVTTTFFVCLFHSEWICVCGL